MPLKVIDETDKISEKSAEGDNTEFIDSVKNTSEVKTQASTLPEKQETFEQTFGAFQKIMAEDVNSKWKEMINEKGNQSQKRRVLRQSGDIIDQVPCKIWERKHDVLPNNLIRSESIFKGISIMAFLIYFKETSPSQKKMVLEEKVLLETETEKIQYTMLKIPNFSPRDNLTRTTFTRVDDGCFIEVKSIVRDDFPEKEGVTRMFVHTRGLLVPTPDSPEDSLTYKCLSVSSMGGSIPVNVENQ